MRPRLCSASIEHDKEEKMAAKGCKARCSHWRIWRERADFGSCKKKWPTTLEREVHALTHSPTQRSKPKQRAAQLQKSREKACNSTERERERCKRSTKTNTHHSPTRLRSLFALCAWCFPPLLRHHPHRYPHRSFRHLSSTHNLVDFCICIGSASSIGSIELVPSPTRATLLTRTNFASTS